MRLETVGLYHKTNRLRGQPAFVYNGQQYAGTSFDQQHSSILYMLGMSTWFQYIYCLYSGQTLLS